jgi:hypothetical protein
MQQGLNKCNSDLIKHFFEQLGSRSQIAKKAVKINFAAFFYCSRTISNVPAYL